MRWATSIIAAQQMICCAWAQVVAVPLPGAKPDKVSPPIPDAGPEQPNIENPATGPTFGGTKSAQSDNANTASVPLPTSSARPRILTPPTLPANPYGRAVALTLNVNYFGRDLGEVPVKMDINGRVTLNSAAMIGVLKPLLTDEAVIKLAASLNGHPELEPAELNALGIDARFDRSAVSIEIARIDSRLRKVQPIYAPVIDRSAEEVNAFPSSVSGFVNVSVAQSRLWNGTQPGFRNPSIFLASAVRAGPIVVEGEGQFADRNLGLAEREFRFDRNFVRLVYDLPAQYTRLFAGDLSPETRFQQSFVQMGGIGLSRQRRRFDQFRTAVLQGNRQLLLQRESTVEVYRNGVLYQQLQLAPGAYDLGSLPLTTGSNDISLKVQGLDGTTQSLQYQAYLDPIDLDPGDYEVGAYFGKMSNQFGLSPKYDGEWAFTGFYRKAFLNHPAIGLGVQASNSVQQVSAQTQFLIGWGGRLDVTGAVSRSKVGRGFLAGLSYDLAIDKGDRADTLSIQALYQSRYFTGISSPFQVNSNALNLTTTYTRTFNSDFSAQLGGNYVRNVRPIQDDYRLFVDAFYRLSRRWQVRGGIDYQHFGQGTSASRQNGFGFHAALVFRPNSNDRMEARYDYRPDRTELSYDHSSGNHVGAVSYGGVVSRSPQQSSASGGVSYIANRFDVGLRHSMVGADFGGITDRQVTTMRVGTALTFAGGAVALGRRVGDSFAILAPHKTLKGKSVISGQDLEGGRYRSKSGTFGGAVNGYLSSYIVQTVQYDVEDPPLGYDVGAGVFRVRPPYRSGYRLVVGTDAFVTAAGTLTDAKGEPVKLASGQVVDLADHKAKVTGFFTSSAGRFALAALKPGGRYRVQLSSGEAFQFTVPTDIDGFYDLRTLKLPSSK